MLSTDQAAYHVKRCWGARLTWTTQRALAMNIAHAIAGFEQISLDSRDLALGLSPWLIDRANLGISPVCLMIIG